MMEKHIRIGLLLECYPSALTEHQRNMMSMYYDEDMSLAEIAGQTSVSRQAVHDTIKRAEQILEELESESHMLDDRIKRQKTVEEMLELVTQMRTAGTVSESDMDRLENGLLELKDL